MAVDSWKDLPPDMKFHGGKRLNYEWTEKTGWEKIPMEWGVIDSITGRIWWVDSAILDICPRLLEMILKRVYTLLNSWDSLEDFDQIFWGLKSTLCGQYSHRTLYFIIVCFDGSKVILISPPVLPRWEDIMPGHISEATRRKDRGWIQSDHKPESLC